MFRGGGVLTLSVPFFCFIIFSPGWMERVALQEEVPAVLAAVTQYDPALCALSSFISRVCVSPSV